MKKKTALVVYDPFLEQPNPLIHKYLFGNEAYQGVLKHYILKGHNVEVLGEGNFNSNSLESFSQYSHFDFQFSWDIPTVLIEALLSENKTISGWCPVYAVSKVYQSWVLSKRAETSNLLPRQIIACQKEQLRNIDKNKVYSWFEGDYLIVKSFYSSRSRMPDGSEYYIFHKKSWDKFVDIALLKDKWFIPPHGIIISEFIETQDESLNNNNAVVHKVHIPAGLSEDIIQQWPLKCSKMSGKFHIDRVGDNIITMADGFELQGWAYGDLEAYRGVLKELIRTFFPLLCLFSVDLMVSSAGKINFLEMNKIAGTFLESLGKGRTVLDEYMDSLLSWEFNPKTGLKTYLEYKAINDTIQYPEDGIWIGR